MTEASVATKRYKPLRGSRSEAPAHAVRYLTAWATDSLTPKDDDGSWNDLERSVSGEIRNHAGLIWGIAELLRGDYKQADYGKFILSLVGPALSQQPAGFGYSCDRQQSRLTPPRP